MVLLGASWHGDLEVLAPIYFCPVGTVLAFSLKTVPAVDYCARLYTESNLLLISSFLFQRHPTSGRHRGGYLKGRGVDIFSDGDTSMTQEPPFSQFRPS